MDAPEISGGRIGTALLGYRLKDKHKPNSMPGPRPPPERKAIPGGVMNMAGMQKSPKEGKLSPRKCATGPIGGLDDARLRMAKESTQTIVLLPGFGHDLPGGRFNLADTRNMKDGKETTGGFVDFQGCGETIQPGGRFNLSGSRKRMFRTTYLDEV